MKEEKEIFKYNKFSSIMTIITFLIGIDIYIETAIGVPFSDKIIIFWASFIPFLIFLFITRLSYRLKEKYPKKSKTIFKIISIILSSQLIFYYIIAVLICYITSSETPITNLKYYHHCIDIREMKKVFPSKIPNNAKNVELYCVEYPLPLIIERSLYYIDDNMTSEKFDKMYKNKAIWVGYKNEYNEKEGLLTGVFSHTPIDYKSENDYKIYLIEGECDKTPGYCNHGDYLIAAFNEKTSEVVYQLHDW